MDCEWCRSFWESSDEDAPTSLLGLLLNLEEELLLLLRPLTLLLRLEEAVLSEKLVLLVLRRRLCLTLSFVICVANGLAVIESYSDPSSKILISLMEPSMDIRVLSPLLVIDAFVDSTDAVDDVVVAAKDRVVVAVDDRRWDWEVLSSCNALSCAAEVVVAPPRDLPSLPPEVRVTLSNVDELLLLPRDLPSLPLEVRDSYSNVFVRSLSILFPRRDLPSLPPEVRLTYSNVATLLL